MTRSLASLPVGFGLALTFAIRAGTGNAAPLDPHDFTSLGLANFTTDVSYNVSGPQPTLGDFTGVYASGVAVFTFDSFSLGPAATMSQSGVGGPPIAILSRGDIRVQGTIDVSARSSFAGTSGPGPGGHAGGAGGAPGTETNLGGPGAKGGGAGGGGPGSPTFTQHPTTGETFVGGFGGGGAGFGGTGTIGDGGEGAGTSSARGPAVPGRLIDNLMGGSGGGGGAGGFAAGPLPGNAGGGGGGALALVAEGLLELAAGGAITATGAPGEATDFVEGAGGGGSGGGVLMYGDAVDVAGLVSVEGGSGGGGAFGFFGGAGGGGKIEIYYDTSFVQTGFVNISGGLTSNAGAYRGGDGIYLVERLTEEPTEVPVPGSVLLFGPALAAIVFLRDRLTRRPRSIRLHR